MQSPDQLHQKGQHPPRSSRFTSQEGCVTRGGGTSGAAGRPRNLLHTIMLSQAFQLGMLYKGGLALAKALSLQVCFLATMKPQCLQSSNISVPRQGFQRAVMPR